MGSPQGMLIDANPLMPLWIWQAGYLRREIFYQLRSRSGKKDMFAALRRSLLLLVLSFRCSAAHSEPDWDFITRCDVSHYQHHEDLSHYHNLHQNLTEWASVSVVVRLLGFGLVSFVVFSTYIQPIMFSNVQLPSRTRRTGNKDVNVGSKSSTLDRPPLFTGLENGIFKKLFPFQAFSALTFDHVFLIPLRSGFIGTISFKAHLLWLRSAL